MSEDKFDQLSEKDWRWATAMASGLNQAEISQILADHDLDFEKDGYRKCEEAILKYGPDLAGKRRLN